MISEELKGFLKSIKDDKKNALEGFPSFHKSGKNLYAYLAKDKLVCFMELGHGKGDGFDFRIYKSKIAIEKKVSTRNKISYEEFQSYVREFVLDYFAKASEILFLSDNPNLLIDNKKRIEE